MVGKENADVCLGSPAPTLSFPLTKKEHIVLLETKSWEALLPKPSMQPTKAWLENVLETVKKISCLKTLFEEHSLQQEQVNVLLLGVTFWVRTYWPFRRCRISLQQSLNHGRIRSCLYSRMYFAYSLENAFPFSLPSLKRTDINRVLRVLLLPWKFPRQLVRDLLYHKTTVLKPFLRRGWVCCYLKSRLTSLIRGRNWQQCCVLYLLHVFIVEAIWRRFTSCSGIV